MSTHRRLVAAVPAPWSRLLAGPPRTVEVLHRGADAVYLDLRGSQPAGEEDRQVLGVLSSSATHVPCGLATLPAQLPPDVTGATEGVLGAGRVLLGGTEVVATRILDTTVPGVPGAVVDTSARLLEDLLGDRLSSVRAELPAAALGELASGAPACVPALVGRGSGLTPVGDDVLCGWLATVLAVHGPRSGTPVADALRRHAPTATTALSATLLACAARGEVLPEFRRLVLALADPTSPDAVHRTADHVDALLRVGHTSGAGLLLGATTALHHLASRSLTR